MDIAKTLLLGYPNADWSLNGETYDGLTWLSNTTKPTLAELEAKWEEVSNPPPVVTMRSLQLCMTPTQATAIAAAIATMPEGPQKREALIYWNRSPIISRAHPAVTAFASMINMTSTQIDALFAAAKRKDAEESQYMPPQ
jgi:hypothetical protein